MASQCGRVRAITAGISCGVSVAVPALAVVATLPFDSLNRTVAAYALPVAAGMLAGTGVTTLASWAVERREERSKAGDTSSVAVGEAPKSAEDEDVERFFGGHSAPKGVPVIARAQNAPSDAEAWAEIDAFDDDDSPISCDPSHSKDIYEIAFEELRRGTQAAQPANEAHAPGAADTGQMANAMHDQQQSWASVPLTPASATAVFMALAGTEGASTTAVSAPAQEGPTDRLDAAVPEMDTDAARREALASLAETTAPEVERPEASSAEAAPPRDPVLGETSRAMSAAVPEAAAQPQGTVPVHDYTGHEDTWSAALDILAELDAEPMVAEPEPPAYQGKHFRSAASLTQPTLVPPSPERAAAVDEGARATERHRRVNDLLQEEFNRVPSRSVRRASHEYLKVIQGGTSSMPPLRAGA